MIVRLFGLAAVASLATLPFLKVCHHAPESECRSNLKGWHLAQWTSWKEQGRYAPTPDVDIEAGNRYLYAWAPVGALAGARVQPWGALPDRTRERAAVPRHLIPTVVSGGVAVGVTPDVATAVCVAQLDDDDEVDVWSVSTIDRISAQGERITSGNPFHERADRHE